MREIERLKLSAELVVLSACDTAEGQLTSEGVTGFSRAFTLAGVPSLVLSLWSIPDAPTALLMQEFYSGVRHQRNKAQALRDAMLRTMRQYPNPGNWAAFELIGEAAASPALYGVRGNSPEVKADLDWRARFRRLVVVPEDITGLSELPDSSENGVELSFQTAFSGLQLRKLYCDTYLGRGLRQEIAEGDEGSFHLWFLDEGNHRKIAVHGDEVYMGKKGMGKKGTWSVTISVKPAP
jgi:hypothetical protein